MKSNQIKSTSAKLTLPLILAVFVFFQNCDSSYLANRPILNKAGLQNILKNNQLFNQVINSELDYLAELQNSIANLSAVEKSNLQRISDKVTNLVDFQEKTTQDEKDYFLNLTKEFSSAPAKSYDLLVAELNRSYEYSQQDLQSLLIDGASSKKAVNVRVSSYAGCLNYCSNIAEGIYWSGLQSLGSDGSAAYANTIYYACGLGCAYK